MNPFLQRSAFSSDIILWAVRWYFRRNLPIPPAVIMDETYVKVNGRWAYLYWAVDSRGRTVDFISPPVVTAKLHTGSLGKIPNNEEVAADPNDPSTR